jgi:toxin ParE1/3/4
MTPVRFLSGVFNDLASAADWYEGEVDAALAERFLMEFYSAMPRISRTPQMYRKVYKEFRGFLLHRFPYKVFYRVTKQEVIVALVSHCSRDPETTKRTLDSRT